MHYLSPYTLITPSPCSGFFFLINPLFTESSGLRRFSYKFISSFFCGLGSFSVVFELSVCLCFTLVLPVLIQSTTVYLLSAHVFHRFSFGFGIRTFFNYKVGVYITACCFTCLLVPLRNQCLIKYINANHRWNCWQICKLCGNWHFAKKTVKIDANFFIHFTGKVIYTKIGTNHTKKCIGFPPLWLNLFNYLYIYIINVIYNIISYNIISYNIISYWGYY